MPPLPTVIAWAATVGFFVGTIIFFRAGSLEAAWRIYGGMFMAPSLRLPGRNVVTISIICATALPSSYVICRSLTERVRLEVAAALAIASMAVLIAMRTDVVSAFVYFQF